MNHSGGSLPLNRNNSLCFLWDAVRKLNSRKFSAIKLMGFSPRFSDTNMV